MDGGSIVVGKIIMFWCLVIIVVIVLIVIGVWIFINEKFGDWIEVRNI